MLRSILVSIFLVLLTACAPSHYAIGVNPLTGTITGSVDIAGTDATITTTIPGSKAIDPCGETRSISRVEIRNIYGRGVTPWLSTRALGDERSLARECKTVQRDLKLEKRNADVALDYTSRRSMKSAFVGFWGFHRTLCPLSQASVPIIESPVEVVTNPPVSMPSVDPGLPPSGIIPPPEAREVSNALQRRVENLETRVATIDTTLNRLQIDVSKILAAVQK